MGKVKLFFCKKTQRLFLFSEILRTVVANRLPLVMIFLMFCMLHVVRLSGTASLHQTRESNLKQHSSTAVHDAPKYVWGAPV